MTFFYANTTIAGQLNFGSLMSSPIALVTLKDGTQVPEPVLISTLLLLEVRTVGVALFDLVKKCNEPDYKFIKTSFGDSQACLKKYALLDEDGKVSEIVKRIVLNGTERKGVVHRVYGSNTSFYSMKRQLFIY